MLERSLFHIVFASSWGRQMRFITGPRQSGKTTLAKLKLKETETRYIFPHKNKDIAGPRFVGKIVQIKFN